MEKEFSWKITWVSFVGNIIIFLHHANLKDYYLEKATIISVSLMNFFTYLAMFAMSWFFFISGYLFFRNFQISKYKEKIQKRCKTLLVPYLIWNTFSVILQLLKGKDMFGAGLLSFVKTNYIYEFGGGCANGPLWYIFRLLEFAVLAPVFYYLIRDKKVGLIVIGAVYILNLITGTDYFAFWYFVPIYLLGAWIGLNFHSDFEKKPIKTNKSRIIAAFVLMIVIAVFLMSLEIDSVSYLVRILCLIPLFYVVRNQSFPSPKEYTKMGMFIYCLHDIVFRILRNVITLCDLNMILSWCLLIVLSMGAIIVVWMILKRFMPKTLNVLTGGRD